MPAPAPQHFTARQIAEALGISRAAMHRRLCQVSPDARVIVSGNQTKVWGFETLPDGVRERLALVAKERGHHDALELLRGQRRTTEPEARKPKPVRLKSSRRPKTDAFPTLRTGRFTGLDFEQAAADLPAPAAKKLRAILTVRSFGPDVEAWLS